MSKLIYRTRKCKMFGAIHESFMTHVRKGHGDDFPPDDVQEQAMELTGQTLDKLVMDLKDLGYNPQKVRFQIHYGL